MEFITEEVKTSLGLNDDQIAGLTPLFNDHIAGVKNEFSKSANDNAEGILNGAASKVAEVTKVPRNQGEKIADYILRANNEFSSSLKSDLEAKKAEYEQKLKDFKGDDATKEELQKAKSELDLAKQKLADYDDLKLKADQFEETSQTLSKLKLDIAFRDVKPNFPDTANPYEVKAKWDAFVQSVLEKYIIEIVDGEPMAIDKENEHKRSKLIDLVQKDEEIAKLSQGRDQRGTGGSPKDKEKIDGVPFEVPKETTTEERSKAIQDYLLTQGIDKTSKQYSSEFAKYNELILKKGK
jgi:hypothetical protein